MTRQANEGGQQLVDGEERPGVHAEDATRIVLERLRLELVAEEALTLRHRGRVGVGPDAGDALECGRLNAEQSIVHDLPRQHVDQPRRRT